MPHYEIDSASGGARATPKHATLSIQDGNWGWWDIKEKISCRLTLGDLDEKRDRPGLGWNTSLSEKGEAGSSESKDPDSVDYLLITAIDPEYTFLPCYTAEEDPECYNEDGTESFEDFEDATQSSGGVWVDDHVLERVNVTILCDVDDGPAYLMYRGTGVFKGPLSAENVSIESGRLMPYMKLNLHTNDRDKSDELTWSSAPTTGKVNEFGIYSETSGSVKSVLYKYVPATTR